VPMTLTRPLPGRDAGKIYAELRETGRGAQLPAAQAHAGLVERRRVGAAEPRRCCHVDLWHKANLQCIERPYATERAATTTSGWPPSGRVLAKSPVTSFANALCPH
jgi:hypothetical protein